MGRLVGYGRSEQRRDRRRETTFPGCLNGIDVRLVNVSHGGIEFEIVDGADLTLWTEGQTTTLQLAPGDAASAVLEMKIVRVDGEHRYVAASFAALSDEQYTLIEQLVLRGRLPAVG